MIKRILAAAAAFLLLTCSALTCNATSTVLPSFNDIEGHWAFDAIEYVASMGLMNGTGNGDSFSPDMNLTRGMVVTVLYRDAGAPKIKYKGVFADVDKDNYFAAAAEWAYGVSIVNGTGGADKGKPNFTPDRPITRQELSAMFSRYAALRHVDVTMMNAEIEQFSDADKVAAWAEDTVRWSVGVGLITGKTRGAGNVATLSPEDNATRAEFAVIIQRFKTTVFNYHLV